MLRRAKISYIKWDFNRSLSNVFTRGLSADRQGEVAHRFDAGILFYSPQIWCSDNTEAINRLKIQKGTTYGYPVSTIGSHVSASPNHQTGREVPLMTRAIVAMAGTFGYELDPRTLSADEKAMIRRQIDFFNRYYDLIQRGMYLRLSDELDEEYYTSWGFVSEDKSEALLNLVVTDVRANPEVIYVLMRNLDPEAMYEVDNCISSCEKVPENDAGEKADVIGQVFSGAALMNAGYAFDPVFGSYPAIQLHFRKKC